jgi:hypothetical protein
MLLRVCSLVQVRPIPLESSMLQAPLGSNPTHHLLASYQVRHTCRLADTLAMWTLMCS